MAGFATIDSPRLRGLLYLLTFIASSTMFGHVSELCDLDDCSDRERTVIAFGVMSAVVALVLFVGAGLEKRVLRVSELAISAVLVSFTMVAAIVVTLETTMIDMQGTLDDDTSIPQGFGWFAQFLATAALYHFLVYGYSTVPGTVKKKEKEVEVEAPTGEAAPAAPVQAEKTA